jgi:hypothetical protein
MGIVVLFVRAGVDHRWKRDTDADDANTWGIRAGRKELLSGPVPGRDRGRAEAPLRAAVRTM